MSSSKTFANYTMSGSEDGNHSTPENFASTLHPFPAEGTQNARRKSWAGDLSKKCSEKLRQIKEDQVDDLGIEIMNKLRNIKGSPGIEGTRNAMKTSKKTSMKDRLETTTNVLDRIPEDQLEKLSFIATAKELLHEFKNSCEEEGSEAMRKALDGLKEVSREIADFFESGKATEILIKILKTTGKVLAWILWGIALILDIAVYVETGGKGKEGTFTELVEKLCHLEI